MFFFNKNDNKPLISPYEKERKIEQVITMFPLLSRDHFLYSTLERCGWSLDAALPSLQRRHEYLEAEQIQIERRIDDNRIKAEMKQRERERELRLISQVRDVFGSKFTDHQIGTILKSNGYNLESTINHFMRDIEDQEYRERLRREKRLEEEYRQQRQREREEYEREERNKKRVTDLLLEVKYTSAERKREIANTKLFQDVMRDLGKLMEPEIHYVPAPSSQPSPNPFSNTQHLYNYIQPNTTSQPITFSQPSPSSSSFTSNSTSPPPPYHSPSSPFKTLDPFTTSTTTTTTTSPPVDAELLKQLKAMFPNISDEIIKYVLSTETNISLAIQNLLDINIKFEKTKN
ncbi:hypothetical protein DICPUDRAFT_37305 [Dictyostelium purpureum]|uniref:CUE domain-containing protein n=1 Tax=Dictyostelium purpureum TaxID=5786 RepID=F0ZSL2_DICPU|nr:uncharacterized protein DICPUDRAFT_37305 [Dictyostelium purpureum]EGC33067.1 hypothetical protein DICPUDRAFT_37305 [Dictyostelium purpureum]|eukprot:XP_003290417.1 hypothetical protein DICPUDRAFT_37305 [Dictyostelium purpureum]